MVPALKRAFLAALAATTSFALVDAWGTVKPPDGSALDLVAHWLYLLPWASVGALGAALVAVSFLSLGRRVAWRPLLLLGALLAAAHWSVVWGIGSNFRNVELGALLATLVTLGLAVLAAIVYPSLLRFSETNEKVAAAISSVTAVVVVAGLCWVNRDGFAQLDRFTIAAPPVALLVGVLAWFALGSLPRVAARAWWVGGTTLVLGAIAAVAVGLGRPSVPANAADDGPWSRALARAVHLATDFDGDGSSSFFGGSDCAPFDDEVGPGQLEVPGDGIDNNCIGGDATEGDKPTPPVWRELPEDFGEFNFLLISVEALRPDHTGFGGYERKTTPHLDRLAKNAVVFENFYAASTFTRLSLPALLTSRTPSRLDFEKQEGKKIPRLAESNPWLPEALKTAGFRTGAVMANFSAFTSRDSMGFDRGFDVYDVSAKIRYRGGTMQGFAAKKQAAETIEFIESSEGRFFAWVHFLEPHYKYEAYPGSPDFGDDAISLYDREVWGVDESIGKILTELRRRDLLDKTIIFVTGDHGEEFMEHGKRFHGSNLYEPQVRTVGLLWVPGIAPQRLKVPATAVDVAPTVANLLGVKKNWPYWTGRNLTPLLFGEAIEDRQLLLETWSVTTLTKYMAAIIAWPYKGIWHERGQRFELYDLEKDRAEEDDLSDDPDHARPKESLETALQRYVDSNERIYRIPAPAAPKKTAAPKEETK